MSILLFFPKENHKHLKNVSKKTKVRQGFEPQPLGWEAAVLTPILRNNHYIIIKFEKLHCSCKIRVLRVFFPWFSGVFHNFQSPKWPRLHWALAMRPLLFNLNFLGPFMISISYLHLRALHGNLHLKLNFSIYIDTKKQKFLRFSTFLKNLTLNSKQLW